LAGITFPDFIKDTDIFEGLKKIRDPNTLTYLHELSTLSVALQKTCSEVDPDNKEKELLVASFTKVIDIASQNEDDNFDQPGVLTIILSKRSHT